MSTRTRLAFALAALALVAAPTERTFGAVCPPGSTVLGIDVSEFQGSIDWNAVKASGRQFAIIRVSDGTGFLDQTFNTNWPAAKAAGMIRGIYQFFRPAEDPVAQANLVLSKMGPLGPGDLPPMIDVEVTGGQSPATITAKIHQWVDTIEKATGRKPLVYTGAWFWDPSVQSGDFVSYPLVDSWYTNSGAPSGCPNIASPWTQLTIWQYSSTGAVSGISGHVDLDQFWGTQAELDALAGGSPDYAAKYVSQTWPLASMALNMVVNESVAGDIVLKNVGKKPWDANTKLGTTQPRDRASLFVAPDWLAPNRAANCAAGAAPGADCKFAFTFHAPEAPGDYHEFFNVVQEGVAWFSDPNQGGPADDQIEAWIHVAEADYHAQFVSQSFPLASQGGVVNLAQGESQDGYIELKNVGNKPWKAGETKLVPTPRDKPSPVGATNWLSMTRVSSPTTDVPPGASYKFPLTVTGNTQGDFPQTFGLVEENVTWFADAPAGGGPADDLIQVHVVVGPPMGGPTDDGGSELTGDGGTGTPTEDAGTTPTTDGGRTRFDGGNSTIAMNKGCGCSTTQTPDASAYATIALALAALFVTRRKR